jgi:ubiquitin carboxyl-terminal hydrolase 5/13
LAVDNASAEVALNWAMEHMEDPGVNDPIAPPAAAAAPAASGKPAPPEDAVIQLMGMGFDRDRCVYALGQTVTFFDIH